MNLIQAKHTNFQNSPVFIRIYDQLKMKKFKSVGYIRKMLPD